MEKCICCIQINEDDYDKVTLQCDDVLEQLKTANGHVSKNVLKKQQSFINGVGLTFTISILVDTKVIHVRINAPSFLSILNFSAPIEKQLILKTEMLNTKSINIASMVKRF